VNKRPANARLLGALLLTGLASAMAACNALIGLEPGEPEKTGSGSAGAGSGLGGGAGVTASVAVSGSNGTASAGTTGGSTSSTSTGSTSSTGSGGSTCPAPATAPLCGGNAWAHWHPEPGATCTDRFATTNDNDTVFDKVTGLTWQRTGPSLLQTWAAAVLYCDHYGDGSPYAWRLPTRIELASIADFSRKEPIIDLNVFLKTPPEIFWTSSTYAADKTKAWYVAFGGFSFNPRAINYDDKIRSHYVRCVR
jgi:Protein of unknown function (DUF1566)